jgi:hypothetical protein
MNCNFEIENNFLLRKLQHDQFDGAKNYENNVNNNKTTARKDCMTMYWKDIYRISVFPVMCVILLYSNETGLDWTVYT